MTTLLYIIIENTIHNIVLSFQYFILKTKVLKRIPDALFI